MTTSIADEVNRRPRGKPGPRGPGPRRNMTDDLAAAIRDAVEAARAIRFPSPRYREHPVEFFREILGCEPWHKQIEIIEAIRDSPRVAVRSGHKVSKSHTAAGVALWFYCSFDDARVCMSSVTARQVEQILWRELMMLRARAGRCITCKRDDPEGLLIKRPCPHSALITGELGHLARTGLKSDDFREIVGYTGREAEAVAGVSGRNVLFIFDEASGIADAIFEATEGNRAGGARVALFGNPTRNEGEFFEAFHGKSAFYRTVHVSSEDSPNVVTGRIVIPGLATREWIDEKREEWGEDSPLYRVRIKGEFALNEAGRIFNLHLIAQAEQRWYDTPNAGGLSIGLDPAGESGMGDETVFCIRRGLKCLALRPFLGLTTDQHLGQLLAILYEFRLPQETPMVVLDRGGEIGARICILLRTYLDAHPHAFDLLPIRPSDNAIRDRKNYAKRRDELAANLRNWFRAGGVIPEDVKLEKELHVLQFVQLINGQSKLIDKKQIRKMIGRSPDRYDALSLAAWERSSLEEDSELSPDERAALDAERAAAASGGGGLDPYAGSAMWEPKS